MPCTLRLDDQFYSPAGVVVSDKLDRKGGLPLKCCNNNGEAMKLSKRGKTPCELLDATGGLRLTLRQGLRYVDPLLEIHRCRAGVVYIY